VSRHTPLREPRLLLVLFCGLVLLLTPACRTVTTQTLPQADFPYPELLHALGLTLADLRISGDLIPDPDRLGLTRRLLDRPLSATRTIAPLRRRLSSGKPQDILSAAALSLGLERIELPRPTVLPGLQDTGRLSSHLPLRLLAVLAPLAAEVVRASEGVLAERARFSGDELQRLMRLRTMVNPDSVLTEVEGDSVLSAGRRVDRARLAAIAARLLAAVEQATDALADLPDTARQLPDGLIEVPSSAGPIVVAGRDADIHRGSAALLVDLGGDDRYLAGVGTSDNRIPVSVCIDLGGADVYEKFTGFGWLGIGIGVDVSGRDEYAGEGQGCGVAGVGVLVDREGKDRYRGGVGAQGFGMYGIGLLCDLAGSDRYRGDLLVQGAGGPGGAGILMDLAGDDHYEAGGRFPDFREKGVYLSMAQGFGHGLRPRASGGVGMLVDVSGDDVYEVDYFGQGAANWAGTGLLLDESGSDRYRARRYAQGVGTHLSAGLLLDRSGNDLYSLWGVGQGCGHDLSVGILLDRSGDDHYRADWLAMGAGNFNGIGIFEDASGQDVYESDGDGVGGSGTPARDYGSIGLFVDREGEDAYSGPGVSGAIWTKGLCGAGVDLPVIEP
jgi:hypothetical protein